MNPQYPDLYTVILLIALTCTRNVGRDQATFETARQNGILEVGRNQDGMFYNEVNMVTGEPVDSNIVDNWGYIYNAYYTIYLLDNRTDYRDAAIKSLKTVNRKYRNFNWENGSSDGYTDAIESGINLYNREPVPELKDWLDSEIKIMWSMQDTKFENSGIIEGWHGDGNFVRTTIMYCLWKSNDLTVQPWRSDLCLDSVLKDSTLYISLEAAGDWQGRLFFGQERHREIFHLPLDYPGINQFPEWFVIDENANYSVSENNTQSIYNGKELKTGINLAITGDVPHFIKISKLNLACGNRVE